MLQVVLAVEQEMTNPINHQNQTTQLALLVGQAETIIYKLFSMQNLKLNTPLTA